MTINFGAGQNSPPFPTHNELGAPKYYVTITLARRPDASPNWGGRIMSWSQVDYYCYARRDLAEEACVVSAIQDFLSREVGSIGITGLVRVKYSYRDLAAGFTEIQER
jgi:hypothetical protein